METGLIPEYSALAQARWLLDIYCGICLLIIHKNFQKYFFFKLHQIIYVCEVVGRQAGTLVRTDGRTEGRTYAKIKAPLSVIGNEHGLCIPRYGVSCDHLQQDKILRHCLPS